MGVLQLAKSITFLSFINDIFVTRDEEEGTAENVTVYPDFTKGWFLDIGQGICLFLFTNALLNNFNKLKNFVKALVKRF